MIRCAEPNPCHPKNCWAVRSPDEVMSLCRNFLGWVGLKIAVILILSTFFLSWHIDQTGKTHRFMTLKIQRFSIPTSSVHQQIYQSMLKWLSFGWWSRYFQDLSRAQLNSALALALITLVNSRSTFWLWCVRSLVVIWCHRRNSDSRVNGCYHVQGERFHFLQEPLRKWNWAVSRFYYPEHHLHCYCHQSLPRRVSLLQAVHSRVVSRNITGLVADQLYQGKGTQTVRQAGNLQDSPGFPGGSELPQKGHVVGLTRTCNRMTQSSFQLVDVDGF